MYFNIKWDTNLKLMKIYAENYKLTSIKMSI